MGNWGRALCRSLIGTALFAWPWAAFGEGSPAQGRVEGTGLTGREIAERINQRDEGERLLAEIALELIDRNGNSRVREVRTVRRDLEEQRQAIFLFDEPAELRGTGLLVHDYREAERDDDQWLYLPAARRVRRVVTGERGGSFVGTDFSFEDMKNGTRVGIADYRWELLRREVLDDVPCYVVEATAVDEETAAELGYGRVEMWVDAEIWMVRRAEIWDPRGERLKTVETRDIRRVEGIWTAHSIDVEHHQASHRTRLTLRRADYSFAADEEMFTERTLMRGLRR